MTSVSAGHIILTPTQPVGSGRPQRESNLGPPHQESRALPTELPRPLSIGKYKYAAFILSPTLFLSLPPSISLTRSLSLSLSLCESLSLSSLFTSLLFPYSSLLFHSFFPSLHFSLSIGVSFFPQAVYLDILFFFFIQNNTFSFLSFFLLFFSFSSAIKS